MTVPKPIVEMLREGETLLWLGKPRPGFLLTPYQQFFTPIKYLFLTMMAIVAGVMLSSTTGFFLVFAAGFLGLVVLRMLQFPLELLGRRNTDYIVTDQRIAIKRNTFLDRSETSVEYTPEFQMTPVDSPRGTTTICFGSGQSLLGFAYPRNYPLNQTLWCPAFECVDDAITVMDLIIDARDKFTFAR